MNLEDLIKDVKRLNLQPGDVVVFRTKVHLNKEQAKYFQLTLDSVFRRLDAAALVVGPDVDVELMLKNAKSSHE